MAIISKVDNAKAHFVDKILILGDVMRTQRSSATTRAEMTTLREASKTTGVCAYCGKPVVIWSTRHSEACESCGKNVDRMLQLKSNVLGGTQSKEALLQLKQLYKEMKHVPPSLRGASGNTQDIVDAIDVALDAESHYRLERKASCAREAAEYLRNKRRSDILAMLVQCGADPDAEETKQRVEEIYWDRYADEC